ncbi:MAG TPA: DinB family protein [Gemmatimonas sp.]|nr:DinB family protein [Gemmatimonas sp.]
MTTEPNSDQSIAGATSPAQQQKAADARADALLVLLDDERARLVLEIERIPLALQAQRLVADGWSVIEVVEHVARVDRGVAKLFAAARAGELRAAEAAAAAKAAEAASILSAPLPATIVAKLRDRRLRFEAPERVRPTGKLSAEEAMGLLVEARAALVEAYRTAPVDVLDQSVYAHPYFGPLTLRAWVELSAHHDARHAAQLTELAVLAAMRQ